jgi:Flp pilus assembly pilin Flp
MKVIHNTRKAKRGAALVEYGLIVAGVALVAAVAVSVFGSKTAGMIAASAHVLPGTNQSDNGPIGVGHIVKTQGGNGSVITADEAALTAGTTSMGDALGVDSDTWVQDP